MSTRSTEARGPRVVARGVAPVPAVRRANIGGAPVDLRSRSEAIDEIVRAAKDRGGGAALGVASANLDHVHHFGRRGRWGETMYGAPSVRWLTLLDGHPLVTRVRRLHGGGWPRLAGSDLIEELLDRAECEGLSVGFLGGTSAAHALLAERIERRWPQLRVVGYWAPERSAVVEPDRARTLALAVAECGPQLLFVGLGKPRQELWIADYGAFTGASVMLAFGASADFVSGAVRRAPEWIAHSGLEWLWRLGCEPRRLARRYLVQGPPAYLDVHMHSQLEPPTIPRPRRRDG
ncbi:WecB/TagA/CpsF family glycosyltransferase [Nocardioides sp. B-3]|uniref:WecB/TagA/CpsF family glycosyltransferase n=1 Tax=Nocardioides sp. B-3 TaxID=2895565 RepID=UPI002152E2F4|nr:WecB/TagA/CpsF family glycosyltransferase [Nocardioides sp. B-3]UUZ60414.1 WecB/TagA/CpsF family glycosyltransferase [Nocardioides sp. B-3]